MGCGCGKSRCSPMMIGKILLIVGGLNWGLVGLGMLLGKPDSWNVVHMLLGSWAMFEVVVYVLVGVAAVMKIVGCRCKTCMSAHTCGTDGKMTGGM
ncbi:hypothetical protein A2W67_02220 [Candidatus Nomurabacteria bacterium RIFCSPLOWO2_02_40_28]|nr:MAG: hypothetical protein UT70_C0015G0002 [Candidatus Nomurabacteria bacterium GW2011_GWE2_40_10]KKR39628.1 MAG: hypothetical protein UT74_C0008G0022 [Parcubacteria group bacterium GW2011_GWC1_40_11]KKR65915.1 MAG: hypothetical protein UU07_C0022G0007 [Parcubacteria group bacterium GW2011_GWF1_40_5]KKR74421.1 MAG: hypothetical protein UU17_C0015G0005 [Candidatus Nomurabacteria bacterium GW2011_GWA1_40_8]OGI74226.1 MAG: hypothetical protein A2W50_03720 [Candidatus Nomurabacteria bacterium RIF